MKKVAGSLTVEAAFMMPLLLAVFLLAAHSGILMYMECQNIVSELKEEKSIDTLKLFYWHSVLEDGVENGDSLY